MPTLAAIVVVALLVDFQGVAAYLLAISPKFLLLAVGLHAAIIAALAWRWRLAIRALDLAPPAALALKLTFTATLLNLILPTSVGGDVGRVWLGRVHGVDLGNGTAAALFDRLIGLAALIVLVFGCVPFLSRAIAELLPALLVGLALAGVGMLLIGRPMARVAPRLAGLAGRPTLVAATFAISLLGHLAAALVASVLAYGMGLTLSVGWAILVFPAVMLATVLPISVGGWGVRELAAIPLLGLAGLSSDAAAAIAIAFGVTQLVAAGVGVAAFALLPARIVRA